MMQKLLRKKSGFTLIELMIVVVIIGVLAAVAIPAFIRFIKRSKTTEAASLVRSLYEGAKTYYDRETWGQGVVLAGASTASTACTVDSSTTTNSPSASKTMIDVSSDASFTGLGFAPSGPLYYQYDILTGATGCGNTASNTGVYTFSAIGDLDGDTTKSTFELAVGADAENSLFHGAGLYLVDELE